MKYLTDTNICIYILNQRPPEVIRKFKQFAPEEIVISAITVSELQYGVAKSRHRDKNQLRLNAFLIPFEVLDYDQKAARAYGDIRFGLEETGSPIGSLDLLIAAQAKSRNLILVTNNEKEFNRIQDLSVENWTK